MGIRKAVASVGSAALMGVGLVALSPATTADAAPQFRKWGKATSSNHVLRDGCRKYGYRYRINAPRGQTQAAEIFLVGPRGQAYASDFKITGANPKRGKATFKLCRKSVTYGKYTIKMKVTFRDGIEKQTAPVRPTTFRFTR